MHSQGYGIYYTNNSWLTFQRKTFGSCFNLIFNPTNSNEIFYSTSTRLYKSDYEISSPSVIYSNGSAFTILVDKSSVAPYTLYWMEFLDGGFRKPDTIRTYDSSNDGLTDNLKSTMIGGDFAFQLTWNWAFEVNPFADNDLFFGSFHVFRSEDGGAEWDDISGHGLHADQQDFAWRSDGVLFAANDGGVSYTTTFLPDLWNSSYNMGLRNMYITNFDVENDQFIGGFYHAGTWRWTIGDEKGIRVGGSDGFECFYDPADNADYYSTTQFHGFYNKLGTRYSPNTESNWGQPFFPDPQFSNYFYYCNKRVYVWHKFSGNRGFTDLHVIPDTIRVQVIDVCKSNSNRGYAGFGEGALKFMDFTFGGPMNDRTDSLPSSSISQGRHFGGMAVDELDPDKVWITVKRYGVSNVFFSDDRGLTWEDLSLNLPKIPVYRMVRIQDNNQIYLATEYGVYYKNDDLSEWIRFSSGLPYQKTMDLDIDNGYIYASLWGSGIWRSPLRSICPNNRIISDVLYDNPLDPGFRRLEANLSIISNIHFRGNIGTDVKLAADVVFLTEGFRATSVEDDITILGIEQSKIIINNDDCEWSN